MGGGGGRRGSGGFVREEEVFGEVDILSRGKGYKGREGRGKGVGIISLIVLRVRGPFNYIIFNVGNQKMK